MQSLPASGVLTHSIGSGHGVRAQESGASPSGRVPDVDVGGDEALGAASPGPQLAAPMVVRIHKITNAVR